MIVSSTLDSVQSYFIKSFDKFRKPSEAVSENLPKVSVSTPSELPRNSLPNSETVLQSDGRTKPRSQKQIEAYKKNFANRYKQARSEKPHEKEVKSFLNQVYNKMSVFDPTKDYTKTKDDVSIYDTVVEVQKILQEITSLLQPQDETDSPTTSTESPPPQPKKRQPKPRPKAMSAAEPPKPSPEPRSIYDNAFN